jgi:hypothetical protein
LGIIKGTGMSRSSDAARYGYTVPVQRREVWKVSCESVEDLENILG